MKLPENRKERIQVIVLICIGAVIVFFALVQLGVSPLLGSIRANKAMREELSGKIDSAERFMAQIDRQRAQERETLARLKEISDAYILQDEVGNYLLPATHVVQTYAEQAGLSEIEVRQIGFEGIPLPQKSKATRTFRAYSVRVTASGAYTNLTAFVNMLTKSNPYLSVANLQIAGRLQTPMLHSVNVDVRWPVWVDAETRDGLSVPEAEVKQP